ncbi:MAG: hypothetical protein GY746_01745 [Gammaproteobacteria bacterium]|nr:hypothetical protein [Gammaproteobacteria bacterium]
MVVIAGNLNKFSLWWISNTSVQGLVNFLVTPTNATAQQAFKTNGRPDDVENISFKEFVAQASLTEDRHAIVHGNGASGELNR